MSKGSGRRSQNLDTLSTGVREGNGAGRCSPKAPVDAETNDQTRRYYRKTHSSLNRSAGADELAFALGQVGASENFEILFAGRAERAREMKRIARRYGIPLAEHTPLTNKLSEILNLPPSRVGHSDFNDHQILTAATRLKYFGF